MRKAQMYSYNYSRGMCPFTGCKLGCYSEKHHRARYAQLDRSIPVFHSSTDKLKPSPKINYDILEHILEKNKSS
jgi:hypothetical protein